MTTDTITLHRTSSCWEATFSGPHAEEVRHLMGTTTIPTPWRPSASADTVRRDIERRNPGCVVVAASH